MDENLDTTPTIVSELMSEQVLKPLAAKLYIYVKFVGKPLFLFSFSFCLNNSLDIFSDFLGIPYACPS